MARYCQICKRPIEADRAQDMPSTRLCSEHGREIGRFGGEFLRRSRQERTSKEGSLKVNYGGVETRLIRNEKGIAQLQEEFDARREDN